jgi:hypothetical protein
MFVGAVVDGMRLPVTLDIKQRWFALGSTVLKLVLAGGTWPSSPKIDHVGSTDEQVEQEYRNLASVSFWTRLVASHQTPTTATSVAADTKSSQKQKVKAKPIVGTTSPPHDDEEEEDALQVHASNSDVESNSGETCDEEDEDGKQDSSSSDEETEEQDADSDDLKKVGTPSTGSEGGSSSDDTESSTDGSTSESPSRQKDVPDDPDEEMEVIDQTSECLSQRKDQADRREELRKSLKPVKEFARIPKLAKQPTPEPEEEEMTAGPKGFWFYDESTDKVRA